jgi:hypothetical protein
MGIAGSSQERFEELFPCSIYRCTHPAFDGAQSLKSGQSKKCLINDNKCGAFARSEE